MRSPGKLKISEQIAPRAVVTAKLHVMDRMAPSSTTGARAAAASSSRRPSSSGSARVMIERTRLENSTYGIFANGVNSAGP
jgi:hypothetical protein